MSDEPLIDIESGDAPLVDLRRAAEQYLGRPVRFTEETAVTLRDVLIRARHDAADAKAFRDLMADTRHYLRADGHGAWVLIHPLCERLSLDGQAVSCPHVNGPIRVPDADDLGPYLYHCDVRSDGVYTRIDIKERAQ